MQTIKASEFKAKCLHLMDLVNQTNEEIINTKNGKPVSRLVTLCTENTKILSWKHKLLWHDARI
jgi:prevent-host-death family protein